MMEREKCRVPVYDAKNVHGSSSIRVLVSCHRQGGKEGVAPRKKESWDKQNRNNTHRKLQEEQTEIIADHNQESM